MNWFLHPRCYFLHTIFETWLFYLFLERGEPWQGKVDRRRRTSGWISALESLFKIQYGSYCLVVCGNRADIHSQTGDISKCRTTFIFLCKISCIHIQIWFILKSILINIKVLHCRSCDFFSIYHWQNGPKQRRRIHSWVTCSPIEMTLWIIQ